MLAGSMLEHSWMLVRVQEFVAGEGLLVVQEFVAEEGLVEELLVALRG